MNKAKNFPKGFATVASLLIVLTSVIVPSAYAVKDAKPNNVNYLKAISVSSVDNIPTLPTLPYVSLKIPDPSQKVELLKAKSLKYSVLNLKAMDPTNTKKMKRSRAARESIPAKVWATSWTATQISYYESRNNCKDVSSGGTYRGKWQMDAQFWATYGGLKFASRPDLATCEQQDIVAHNGWVSRHYQPWQTYSLVDN